MNEPQWPLADRLALCQQVARLARARLPLPGELAKHVAANSRLKRSATKLDDQLSAGKSLTQALANDSSRDSRILAACIGAGEASGHLDRTLEAWTGMHLSNARSSQSLRAALLYPLLLIAVTLCSLGYLAWTLIPEYRQTYAMFGRSLPWWLELLVSIREQFWWLMVVLAAAAMAPLILWAIRKRRFDSLGLPRDRSRRLRLQGIAAELSSLMIEKSLPLTQALPLAVAATGTQPRDAEEAFGKLQRGQVIEPLGREVSLLLASLYAGLMDREAVGGNLTALGNHLKLQADQIAQRQTRWLPMLIALVVGGLVIATYVLLIYLPWILLLKQIVLPPSMDR